MRSQNLFITIIAVIASSVFLNLCVQAKSFKRSCEFEVGSECDSVIVVSETKAALALIAVETGGVNIPLMHTDESAANEYIYWYSLSDDTLIMKLPDSALNHQIKLDVMEFNAESGSISIMIFHRGNILVSNHFEE